MSKYGKAVRMETPADNISLAIIETAGEFIYGSVDRQEGGIEVSIHRQGGMWNDDPSACVEGLTEEQARDHLDRVIEGLRMLRDSI